MKKIFNKIKNRMWISRLEKIVRQNTISAEDDIVSQGIKNYPECRKCRIFKDTEFQTVHHKDTNVCAIGYLLPNDDCMIYRGSDDIGEMEDGYTKEKESEDEAYGFFQAIP